MERDHSLKLDPWTDVVVGPVHLHVPAKVDKKVMAKLAAVKKSIYVENLQKVVDEETAHTLAHQEQFKSLSMDQRADTIFTAYQDADTYLNFLLSKPGAQEISLGKTYEGRSIRGVKFGTGAKQIFLNGGIHAREWVTPAAATYIANYLLGTEAEAVSLREKFTFHIVPNLNPDGYAYTRKSGGERMWRKNREPNRGSSCIGTDPNRNLDSAWGDTNGASSSPCADDYFGPSAMSSAEAKALGNYLKSLNNVVSYVDVHSYSQLWMFPLGYKCGVKVPDYADLAQATKLAVAALKGVNNLDFKNGPICDTIYQATGTTADYTYDKLKIKYSFALELRPKQSFGTNGFALPPSQIVAASEETLRGLVAAWNYAYTH
ncbi:carbamoyl-phosphate synthase (glutamine-hydrolyzing) cpa2 [Globomyces sp. JEL0801]|nr:carbamoyl-phosphate synthase (glutamine-hydrolyzing) cpa2 [Globomyces sp. JEL0801]